MGVAVGQAQNDFLAIDYVRMAMPKGGEERARAFYGDVLGMTELKRPAAISADAGVWFSGGEGGAVQLRLGAEAEFEPAVSSHPAVLVADIDGLAERLEASGHVVVRDDELDSLRRLFCVDPFGNRLEFVEAFGGE